MNTYKLNNSSYFITRLSDRACIPCDSNNSDYAEYLRWVESGGVPIPADPIPTPPNPRISAIKSELIALDARRIRPLAEGNKSVLVALIAEAVALRTELQSLSTQGKTP